MAPASKKLFGCGGRDGLVSKSMIRTARADGAGPSKDTNSTAAGSRSGAMVARHVTNPASFLRIWFIVNESPSIFWTLSKVPYRGHPASPGGPECERWPVRKGHGGF